MREKNLTIIKIYLILNVAVSSFEQKDKYINEPSVCFSY